MVVDCTCALVSKSHAASKDDSAQSITPTKIHTAMRSSCIWRKPQYELANEIPGGVYSEKEPLFLRLMSCAKPQACDVVCNMKFT